MKIKKYIPTALSVLGACGVIATAILTAKATNKSKDILEKENLTTFEKAKHSSRNYIPAACIGLGTVTCIIVSNIMSMKYQAAIIGASNLITESFNEYKSKVKELYGEEAHRNVVNAIMVEKAEDVDLYCMNFMDTSSLDFGAKEARHTFYLECSDVFFESTISQVLQAEYHLNRNFMYSGYASLGELHDFLGINKDNIPDVGWNMELMDKSNRYYWTSEDGIFWIDFNNYIAKDLPIPEWIDKNQEIYVIGTVFHPELHYDEY